VNGSCAVRSVGLRMLRTIKEMKAEVARNRARVFLAEAEVPLAMAAAFREGNLERVRRSS
jgi:uncharacterized protein YqfA (UPF0365 family)